MLANLASALRASVHRQAGSLCRRLKHHSLNLQYNSLAHLHKERCALPLTTTPLAGSRLRTHRPHRFELGSWVLSDANQAHTTSSSDLRDTDRTARAAMELQLGSSAAASLVRIQNLVLLAKHLRLPINYKVIIAQTMELCC